MTEWIQVSDRVPAHSDNVLAFDPDEGVVMASYLNTWSGDLYRIQPTHWMPLPEPPQTEDHELPPAESNAE